MNNLEIAETSEWSLVGLMGFDNPILHFNKSTLVYTWIALALIAALVIPIRFILKKEDSVLRFALISCINFFIDLCNQAGASSLNHLSFIVSLFSFIFVCNTLSLFPFLEEPTTDLNTTLALGTISFIYTQTVDIYTNGLTTYIKGFFSPFFLMMPLNVIGKLATVISISFRLFGNIKGGSVISTIYLSAIEGSWILETVGILSGLNIIISLFFGFFEGFLQAFVFTMLALTYLGMALSNEGGH